MRYLRYERVSLAFKSHFERRECPSVKAGRVLQLRRDGRGSVTAIVLAMSAGLGYLKGVSVLINIPRGERQTCGRVIEAVLSRTRNP